MYPEAFVDQHPEGKEDMPRGLITFSFKHSSSKPLTDFGNMLRVYSPRALTNPRDILRAMAGLVRRVSDMAKCPFLEGLPTAVFDAFVIFQANSCLLRRREGFPSYSWTGWKGGVVLQSAIPIAASNLNHWLERETWIIWYKRSPSGVLSLVWDPAANEQFPTDDPKYDGYRQRHPFQDAGQLHLPSTQTHPTDVYPLGFPAAEYHVLQFWTLSVHFKLQMKNVFDGSAFILGAHESPIGTIYLDGIEESTFFDSQGPFEFILLSGARRKEDLGLLGYLKYFVMLLERHGPTAERRGLGLVDKAAILDSFPPGPQWKEIILS
jgi:hypothetical protein